MLRKPFRFLILFVLIAFAVTLTPIQPVSAASPGFVYVNWGDTLAVIAARSGTTVDALVRANGLPNPNFIYAGQRLVIPGTGTGSGAPAPTVGNVYTVAPGDTLFSVASRFGTTVDAMMRVNSLNSSNFIWVGQRLNIPGRVNIPPPQPATAPAQPPAPGRTVPPVVPSGGKWIDVDISAQTITAYQGSAPLKSVLVSTGVSWYPTPIGRYAVYIKYASQTMSGGYGANAYYLPGVPWVMYFTGSYAIHGTYWHNSFGKPMSHGCVNLTIADAKWFYDWAEIGTPVVTHL